jgi:hypothetical protein
MEIRLEAGEPGGVSDVCAVPEPSAGAKGNFAPAKRWAVSLVPSDRDACAGSMFVSDECTLQQEGVAMAIDEPQSCVIGWQHAWCGAGARQAKPGSAAHSATIVSMNNAPLLPTRTVYTCP